MKITKLNTKLLLYFKNSLGAAMGQTLGVLKYIFLKFRAIIETVWRRPYPQDCSADR